MNEQVLNNNENVTEVVGGVVEALPEEKTGGVTFGKVLGGLALGGLVVYGTVKLVKFVGKKFSKKAEAQPEQEVKAEVVEE